MKLDSRAGSKDLYPYLLGVGVIPELCTLPAGDVEIVGNGPEGRPALVGVEYKTLPDAVQCIKSGRFAEQLRGMKANYEINWLLLEGRVVKLDGIITQYRPARKATSLYITYQGLMAWVMTMAQAAGMLVWRTDSKEESANWLRTLDLWWTAKDWEEHRAHMDWYQPDVSTNPFRPPTLAQRVAATLPGIGLTKSKVVAQHFKSPKKIFLASRDEWLHIKGMGPKTVDTVLEAMTEEAE